MDDRRPQLGPAPARRGLRGAKRALQWLLGLDETAVVESAVDEPVDEPSVDREDLVDELHRWVVGLPFVEELDAVTDAPEIRRFAVSCPLVDGGPVMLLTGALATGDDARHHIVMAVLPRAVARRIGSEEGLGPDLPGDRCLVAMKSPTSSDELIGVEDIVLTAYLSTFPDE
jgi:hypothetical protein